MALTPNGDDITPLATSNSDKTGGEGIFKSRQVKFLPLKHENQASLIAVTGPSAHFVHISVGPENNVMHHITCLLDTGAKPNLFQKISRPPTRYQRYARKYNRRFYLRRRTHLGFWDKLPTISELEIGLQLHYFLGLTN